VHVGQAVEVVAGGKLGPPGDEEPKMEYSTPLRVAAVKFNATM
jgi:hypothetical protein